MIPSKKQIAHSFNRASASYENVSSIQRRSADFLIDALIQDDPSFSPETILDLGTGTGYVFERLFPHYSQACYTLNDLSPHMLDQVRQKCATTPYGAARVSLHEGDMETLDPPLTSLIISNLAFQWTHHFWQTLEKFYHKSRVLAFSCLVQGTFEEWEQRLQSIHGSSPVFSYPSSVEITAFFDALAPARKRLWTCDFPVCFSDSRSFMTYLQHLGANRGTQSLPLSSLKTLLSTQNHAITVTYKVFFGILSP